MADHFRQRIQAFLEGVFKAVMHRSQGLARDLCGSQVGRTLQTDGEGMKPRPPGF